MATLEVGNTTYVKQNMTDLIQVNQSILDTCEKLNESLGQIKSHWRSEGASDNVDYITKLNEKKKKMYSLTYIISDLAEYVNKYIDDAKAASNNV